MKTIKNMNFKIVTLKIIAYTLLTGLIGMVFLAGTTPEWDNQPMMWVGSFVFVGGIGFVIIFPIQLILEYKRTAERIMRNKYRQFLFFKRESMNNR